MKQKEFMGKELIYPTQEKKDMNPDVYPMVYLSTAHTVAEHFGISQEDMMKKSRATIYRQARQIAMCLDHFLIKEMTGQDGWSHIARYFGKTHATAIWAVTAVTNDSNYDDYRRMFYAIQKKIFGKVRWEFVEGKFVDVN